MKPKATILIVIEKIPRRFLEIPLKRYTCKYSYVGNTEEYYFAVYGL